MIPFTKSKKLTTSSRPIWMGVTKPASLAHPTENEILETDNIKQCLISLNDFPSQQENMKREEVLGKLNKIIQEFVVATAKSQSFGNISEGCTAQLVTSGSFRLGVHGPGADIDTIVILPKFVRPKHFFEDLPLVLNQCPEVKDLTCVSEATVPLIKLEFDGVELDLLYAPIKLDIIPKNLNVLDINLLRGIDQRTVRALNGPRVAQETLDLVYRKDTYRLSLRFIRQWAKRRGIYGNVHGYLGGVHCSILVARICQLFPYASASVIVRNFFTIYGSLWNWPNPVLLKNIEINNDLGFEVWDPTSKKNRFHILPIITPAYPAQNTTHNVHQGTKRVIMEELRRAENLLPSPNYDGIISKPIFSRILEETDFFIRYKTFLKCNISTKTISCLSVWKGFVESRFRFFASNLQRLIGESMLVHVYPIPVKEPISSISSVSSSSSPSSSSSSDNNNNNNNNNSNNNSNNIFTISLFIGLQFIQKRMNVNFSSCIAKFHSIVNTWESKTEDMLPCDIIIIKRSKLPKYVLSDEKKKLFLQRRKRDEKEEKEKLEKQKNEAEEAEKKEKKKLMNINNIELPGLGGGRRDGDDINSINDSISSSSTIDDDDDDDDDDDEEEEEEEEESNDDDSLLVGKKHDRQESEEELSEQPPVKKRKLNNIVEDDDNNNNDEESMLNNEEEEVKEIKEVVEKEYFDEEEKNLLLYPNYSLINKRTIDIKEKDNSFNNNANFEMKFN